MFRIIALRLFADCKAHIVRALEVDTTYFFYRDYKDVRNRENRWVWIEKCNTAQPISDDFFQIDAIGTVPKISISSIVGKNGDGKSSLIEAIIRIVNNFAVEAGFVDDQESLVLAEGVYGVLFFELDGKLHSIECKGNEVLLDGSRAMGNKDNLQGNDALFYTIVDNYSIYSYNSKLFEKESAPDTSWINGVFHKNDSYQTPIVLNPMRTEGNFDINKELDLCRQRLMSLYSDAAGFDGQRLINDGKRAEGFAFSLEKESKLFSKSLRQYFTTHSVWATRSLRPFYSSHEEYLERVNAGEVLPDNYYKEDDFDAQIKFFGHFNSKVINQYKPLFDKASSIHRDVIRQYAFTEDKPEVKRYLESFRPVASRFIKDIVSRQIVLDAVDALDGCCGEINGLELQRVCLIIAIYEKWRKNGVVDNRALFAQVFSDENSIPVERKHALMYLVYKTLSIFSQYKPFINLIDVSPRAFMFFEYPLEGGQDYYNAIDQCFKELFDENSGETEIKDSFDTLKLRQTLNFLIHDDYLLERFESTPSELSEYKYSKYIGFDNLSQVISRLGNHFKYKPIALLPPPIYEGNIIVSDANKNGILFPMSELSSGELQMLNSIGTYTYHLRNLDYPPTTSGMIRYKNVNLILEEVELYFHPEYQKQYIYRMLEQIRQVRFTNVTAINIMIVTHSPFVLSDIPVENILYLQKGMPYCGPKKTPFAANIGDTLKDSFFLGEGFMGDFAKRQIELLLYYLAPDEGALNDENLKQKAARYWTKETALSFINQIGDPLVRGALMGMYNDKKQNNKFNS